MTHCKAKSCGAAAIARRTFVAGRMIVIAVMKRAGQPLGQLPSYRAINKHTEHQVCVRHALQRRQGTRQPFQAIPAPTSCHSLTRHLQCSTELAGVQQARPSKQPRRVGFCPAGSGCYVALAAAGRRSLSKLSFCASDVQAWYVHVGQRPVRYLESVPARGQRC